MHSLFVHYDPIVQTPQQKDPLFEELLVMEGFLTMDEKPGSTMAIPRKRSSFDIFAEEENKLFPFPIVHDRRSQISLLKRKNVFKSTQNHTPVIPLNRSHILFLLSIPSSERVSVFLTKCERYHKWIKFVRTINYSEEEREIEGKYSLVINFEDVAHAEDFFKEFNCHLFNENDELLYILFLCKTTFAPINLKNIIDLKKDYTELPTCPACIEKLDCSITGIYYESIAKLFIYEEPKRWKAVRERCLVCRNINEINKRNEWLEKKLLEKMSTEENLDKTKEQEKLLDEKGGEMDVKLSCEKCPEQRELWLCIICGYLGCGRYKYGHAEEHFRQSFHNFSVEVFSQRIWDYIGDTYVHRLIRNKELLIMNLPDGNREESSMDDKFFQDRIENMVLEYNYLLSAQLEEQRKHFEEKLEIERKRLEGTKDNNEFRNLISEKEAHILEIEKQKQEAMGITKENRKNSKILREKIQKLQSDIDEVKLFNDSIRENIKEFETKIKNTNPYEKEIFEAKEVINKLNEKLEELMKSLD